MGWNNLKYETDNDVMAVAINGQNTTRNTSSNSAQVFLYHNLSLLSSDKYTVKFVSHNLPNGYIPNESNSVKDDNDNPVNRYFEELKDVQADFAKWQYDDYLRRR